MKARERWSWYVVILAVLAAGFIYLAGSRPAEGHTESVGPCEVWVLNSRNPNYYHRSWCKRIKNRSVSATCVSRKWARGKGARQHRCRK